MPRTRYTAVDADWLMLVTTAGTDMRGWQGPGCAPLHTSMPSHIWTLLRSDRATLADDTCTQHGEDSITYTLEHYSLQFCVIPFRNSSTAVFCSSEELKSARISRS